MERPRNTPNREPEDSRSDNAQTYEHGDNNQDDLDRAGAGAAGAAAGWAGITTAGAAATGAPHAVQNCLPGDTSAHISHKSLPRRSPCR